MSNCPRCALNQVKTERLIDERDAARQEIARLTAEVESQRVALDNFTEMYQGLCDELNETRAELDATRGLIDDAAEARRRLGLAVKWLEADDTPRVAYETVSETLAAHTEKVALAKAAFRASLPAPTASPTSKPSGDGNA